MSKNKISVIYNESCSICRMEINHYKKQTSKNLEFIDLNDKNLPENIKLKNKADILRRLHVFDGNQFHIGVDAFALIWGNLDKYKFLKKLLEYKIAYFIAFYIYEVLSFLLYLKNRKQLNE
jgi:predicted DCC family thiol-disulfide oxidoreductase YuxK